jgi:hypothetical protein
MIATMPLVDMPDTAGGGAEGGLVPLDKFVDIQTRADREKCCRYNAIMAHTWCPRCTAANQAVNRLRDAFYVVRFKKDITFAQMKVIKAILDQDVHIPHKVAFFCKQCEEGRAAKRRRVV